MVSFLCFLMCSLIIGCGTDVDRWTTYSYYITNDTNAEIQIIGVNQNDVSYQTDTLLDTVLHMEDELHIYSGYDGFDAGVTSFSLNIESCDSIFILKDGAYLYRCFNFRKDPSLTNIDSSSTVLFQFENQDIWEPYDTTQFDGNGPQPKEIFFRFMIN